MWIDWLKSFGSTLHFESPASVAQVNDAETAIGIPIPPDLRELLLEANGIRWGEYNYGIFVLWNVDWIMKLNMDSRPDRHPKSFYKSLDGILFFSDLGNGDLVGIAVDTPDYSKGQIIFWDHEDDRRRVQYETLRAYLESFARK